MVCGCLNNKFLSSRNPYDHSVEVNEQAKIRHFPINKLFIKGTPIHIAYSIIHTATLKQPFHYK